MEMVWRSWLACGALALLLYGIVPAHAQAPDRCRADGPPDQMLAACSARIKSGIRGRALAETYVFRALAWSHKSDQDHALTDAEQAIRADPSFPRAYNTRGLIKSRKGDLDGALSDYGIAIRLDPSYATPYYNRALAWRSKGDLEGAIADFGGAIAANPRHFNAYVGRALAWRARGQTDREIDDFTSAIHIDPKSAQAYDYRAWSWRTKRDLDRAMEDVNQALALDPNLAGAYNNRALTWRAKGDVDKAVADFDTAIRLDPRAVYALNNRAFAKRAKGDTAGAVEDLTAALEINPNYVAAYTNRGLLYESRGESERARADFTTALSLPPGRQDNSKWAQDTARARLAVLPAAPAARQPGPSGAPGSAPSTPPPVASTPAAPAATIAGARVAAVIGNGAYQNANALPNPVNDARAVARRLRDIGFTVTEGFDLDRLGLERVVRDFLRQAASARIALLYYAGHGMQVDGKNYLVPTDAKLIAPSDLTFETLELDKIMAGLDDETRANILILDACRDNPLARSFAGKSRSSAVGAGLAAYATVGSGTLIAYATAPGRVALDGEGPNSPFTTALVKHIGTPGLEVRQMLTRVRAEVASATRNQQIPWDNSSLLGDVFLADGQKP